MYRTIWQRLGISPTKDEAVIQRAYAAAAKHCHPEDDPAEWACLHDAYLQALRYARGEGRIIVPVPEPARERPPREEEPASAFAEEFEAALARTDRTAERVFDMVRTLNEQKRATTRQQAWELIELLYELRPEEAKDRNAMLAALALLAEREGTAEAYEVISYGLQEWTEQLSGPEYGLERTLAQNALKRASLRRTQAGEQKGVGRKDALFAWAAALVIGLLLLASTDLTFVLIIGAAFAFLIHRLRVSGRYIPRERRFGRRGKIVLAAALLVVYIVSFGASRSYLALGYGKIYEKVEKTYSDFDPSLAVDREACFTVAETPAFLTYVYPSTESVGAVSSVPGARKTQCLYKCAGADGQEALVLLDEKDEEAFLALELPAAVYGKMGGLDVGVFTGKADPNKGLIFYSAEESLRLFSELRELGQAIGPHPVLRYTGSEPGHVTVFAGYEAGHYPYILCRTIRVGCFLHLALLLTRIPARTKKQGRRGAAAQDPVIPKPSG